MSLKTETPTRHNPFEKIIKYFFLILIACTGLFLFGYTKPVPLEGMHKEISL
jgi:hypothetical protein